MRELLLLEIVVVVLLATSFTCVGLLAVWAATSPQHWFVRTLMFLAALSPLLLAPAYEPVVAFAIQGAVVACGVQIRNRWRAKRQQKPHPADVKVASKSTNLRFSLSTLLLVMTLIAIATPVAIKLPVLNLQTWANVVIIGLTCGLVTLVAAQMAASRRKLALWPIGLLLCLAAGFALFTLDNFVEAVVLQSDWPPPPPLLTPSGLTPVKPSAALWPLTLAAIAFLLAVILWLWSMTRVNQRFARCIVGVTIALIAALPLFVLWQLAHPLPVPQVQMPEPNGYDDFVAAGAQFNKSPILNTTVDPKSTAQLAAEVAKFAPAFAQVSRGLSRPCVAPVWPVGPGPPTTSMSFPDIQAIRGVARALGLEADLARQEHRFHDAAMISVDNMRVGEASARGGVVIHYLVAIAVEGIGQWSLYPAIEHLDAQACHVTIGALEQIEQNRESLDAILHRDRIFEENEWGWYGHLLIVLDDIADNRHDLHWATNQATSRATAFRRLLMMELAVRQYVLENGTHPDRLDVLVPKYVSALPIDPYDVNQHPLRYVRTANACLLYSVGFDGDDDGGRPSLRENGWLDDGDMRLDSAFAPDEQEKAAAGNDDAGPDESAARANESSGR